MRKFDVSIYADIQRVKKEGPRKPLRTITEIAEILGISVQMLSKKMAQSCNAPKPAVSNRNKAVSRRYDWYDPGEVVRWWRQREKDAA